MIKKGTWVSVRSTILKAGERAANIPADTAAVPLDMWVKGYLEADCAMGGQATVRTATGRLEAGILEEVEPSTTVDYGNFVPEVLKIGRDARKILFGGGCCE
ncbi:MAG: 2-amino-4-oxopentanoate thiolase subunit OrtA [Defluviitaleaceae bacterium]|nr:2-amino-4-oxopentanoate thiolase subunit OrtA [Defluviitaleaceae bacterium]